MIEAGGSLTLLEGIDPSSSHIDAERAYSSGNRVIAWPALDVKQLARKMLGNEHPCEILIDPLTIW
jgi:hypothetical protein